MRQLITAHGAITFPAYIPVVTFGERLPLDRRIRPFLPRIYQVSGGHTAVLGADFYVRQMQPHERPPLPFLVDSGAFVALLPGARIVEEDGLGCIQRGELDTELLHPASVLALQQSCADVGFTLDIPIPPGLPLDEARRRQRLTIVNARWALHQPRPAGLRLFAVVQGWDAMSYGACAASVMDLAPDGIAIGGLVPRLARPDEVEAIVGAVRAASGSLPVHALGVGSPEMARRVIAAGADSVDSSSYVRSAVEGKRWDCDAVVVEPSETERLGLALANLGTALQTVCDASRVPLALPA